MYINHNLTIPYTDKTSQGRGLMRGARQIASVDKLRATKSDVLIIGVEH